MERTKWLINAKRAREKEVSEIRNANFYLSEEMNLRKGGKCII